MSSIKKSASCSKLSDRESQQKCYWEFLHEFYRGQEAFSMAQVMSAAFEEIMHFALDYKHPNVNTKVEEFFAELGKERKKVDSVHEEVDELTYWKQQAERMEKSLAMYENFVKTISPRNEIVSVHSVQFLVSLQIASIAMVKAYFMDFAKKVAGEYAMPFLNHTQFLLEQFIPMTEDMDMLIEYNPKEFIILSLERDAKYDGDYHKKVMYYSKGGVKPTKEEYENLEKIRQKIEKRLKEVGPKPLQEHTVIDIADEKSEETDIEDEGSDEDEDDSWIDELSQRV